MSIEQELLTELKKLNSQVKALILFSRAQYWLLHDGQPTEGSDEVLRQADRLVGHIAEEKYY